MVCHPLSSTFEILCPWAPPFFSREISTIEEFKMSAVSDARNQKSEWASIRVQADPDRNGTYARTTNREFDRARQYILDSSVTEANSSAVDLSAVRSKIDWRIVPIMFCCYTMQFVDKVLLNVSYIHLIIHLVC